MSTLLAEPLVQEPKAAAQVIPLPRPKATAQKAETNPFITVFVAMVISFAVSTLAIGSVAAWIYILRHSGAFAW
jgi:hypothetical protein